MPKAIIGADGFARCPVHKQKLCRVDTDAYSHGVHLWCNLCKDNVELEIRK